MQKIIENKTKKINLEQMKEKINSCKDKSILSDRICKLIKEKEQKLNQEK